jgi:hypothetical protein
MAKSDYISDNLIHYRDQFRGRRPNISKTLGTNDISPKEEAYSNNQTSSNDNISVEASLPNVSSNIPENSSVLPEKPKLYTPVESFSGVAKNSSENNYANQERELRDIGERLRREKAYLDVKVNEFDIALKEAKLFSSTVEDLISQLEKIDSIKNPEEARKLEHLRIAYFQAQGRFSAFNSPAQNNVSTNSNNLLEAPSKLDKYLLPGVIAGGIILLAIVLICLF